MIMFIKRITVSSYDALLCRDKQLLFILLTLLFAFSTVCADIAGRLVKGGLNTIPYNEVYVRVGGLGRLVDDNDCGTGEMWTEESMLGRSLDNGVGLPIGKY